MRDYVNYSLDTNLKEQIIKVKNSILNDMNDINIYLFGSIAKGRYSKDSDIDILIIVNEDKTQKELRAKRHELEDIVEGLRIERDIDIKLYSKNRYKELCDNICFEKDITKDLIDIRRW